MLSKSQEASVGHYHNNFGRSKMISFYLTCSKKSYFSISFSFASDHTKKGEQIIVSLQFFLMKNIEHHSLMCLPQNQPHKKASKLTNLQGIY